MTKNNEQQLKDKYMEYQLITQNINHLQEYTQSVNQQIMELNELSKNLDYYRKVGKKSKILLPIGPGIFTKADVEDLNELYTNVGSNVIIKKSIIETKKSIEQQQKDMRVLSNQLQNQIEDLTTKQKSITDDIQSLAKSN